MKERFEPSLFIPRQRLETPRAQGIHVPRFELLTDPDVVGLKIEQINPFAKAVDVRRVLEHHHPSWQGELVELARQAKEKVIRGGSVATSLEKTDFNTYYQPTNGLTISREVPWLYNLFRNDFRYLVEKATGDQSMHLGDDLAHSFNMNYTQEGGYEKHIDRNPITALLAVTDMEDNQGGQLVLHEKLDPTTNLPSGRSYSITPRSGVLYIFNGLKHPHEVTGLQRKQPRLVVPGDYYSGNVPEVKDEEFNALIGVADAA